MKKEWGLCMESIEQHLKLFICVAIIAGIILGSFLKSKESWAEGK